MRKKLVVAILLTLMAIPAYAHFYEDDFEGWALGALRPQEGAGTWWGLPFDKDQGIYPYVDVVVEIDPTDPDPNGNRVLNIRGPLGGGSLGDDWLYIHGFPQNVAEGTWIVVEFDLWLEAGVGTGDKRFNLLFYDNDSSDPVSIAWGRTGPGQITNKTGGAHIPVPNFSFDDETWMRVRIILDQTADTIDFFIDGSLLLEGAGIANDAISCERLAFATRDNNDKVLIDNIVTEVRDTPPPFCGDGSHAWLDGDISGPEEKPDCYVDGYDLDAMAQRWLECSDPAEPLCNQ